MEWFKSRTLFVAAVGRLQESGSWAVTGGQVLSDSDAAICRFRAFYG
ncbi:hypothetical protein NYE44_25985 [Paenibacillus sp. FSL L8-0493]